jgi:TrmH family RNA methyltransferase
MHIQKISSKDNKIIKHIHRLLLDSSHRYKHNQAVLFGEHLIIEAIRYQILDMLILTHDSLIKYNHTIKELDSKIIIVTTDIINKISPFKSDTDIIGVVRIKQSPTTVAIYSMDGIYLDNIQDPSNLGAILRIVLAVGIRNVFLSQNSVDCYNYKVLRASQGVQFGLNIFSNVKFDDLKTNFTGKIIATSPRANHTIYEIDYKKTPILWVFGNEGAGISANILEQVQTQVKIPIHPEVESLNIAMATSICLFECMRQRL